jgi:hypothetical protein
MILRLDIVRPLGAGEWNRRFVVGRKRDEHVPDVRVVGEHFRQLALQHVGECSVGRVAPGQGLFQLFFKSRDRAQLCLKLGPQVRDTRDDHGPQFK